MSSRYESDPRVVFNGDESATIPDVPVNGDWTARGRDGVWTVTNPVQGFLRSEHDLNVPAPFPSLDEAIAAIVGDPQASA